LKAELNAFCNASEEAFPSWAIHMHTKCIWQQQNSNPTDYGKIETGPQKKTLPMAKFELNAVP